MALWPIVRWTVPRLGIAYAWAFPFLPMCRHFQRLAYQSGSFCNLQSIWAHLLCRPRAQPPRRTGLWPQGNSRVAALADCWRLRSVVGGSGGSSHLDSSEPNSQKAIGGKDRKGKDCKAKRKRSPKPNVDVGSVLGFYLLFGFL